MSAEFTEQTRWPVREVRRQGTDLQLVVEEPYTIYLRDRIDRAVAVLHLHAPADVRRFVLSFHERGMPLTDWVVLRDEWVARQTRYRAHAEQFEAVVAAEHWPAHSQEKLWAGPAERFSTGLEPSYSQSLGGPDGFILFQLGITAPTELRLADDTWLSGRANLGLVDNYDKYEYDGPSNLPRVRTDIRKYVTESDLTLPTTSADCGVMRLGFLVGSGFVLAAIAALSLAWPPAAWSLVRRTWTAASVRRAVTRGASRRPRYRRPASLILIARSRHPSRARSYRSRGTAPDRCPPLPT